MSAVELLFDTKRYIDSSSEVLAEDLAGLVLENADQKPPEAKINPRKLKIIDGDLIDPKSGKSVSAHFETDTFLRKQETAAALVFYSQLVSRSPNEVFSIWISPPGGPGRYLESRINIGLRITEEDVELYGIPSRLFGKACLKIANEIREMSGQSLLPDPEDLRNKSLLVQIPKDVHPWLFLKEILILDSNAIETIINGSPWKLKEEALSRASEVSSIIIEQIRIARNQMDYVVAGANAEKMMGKSWGISSAGCPGLLNSEVLSLFGFGSYRVDSFGNIRAVEGKFVKSCGRCGNAINTVIKKGYRCSKCGGIYEGC